MAWKNKNDPSVVNDPTYLEPRVSAVETKANNNATALADITTLKTSDNLLTAIASNKTLLLVDGTFNLTGNITSISNSISIEGRNNTVLNANDVYSIDITGLQNVTFKRITFQKFRKINLPSCVNIQFVDCIFDRMTLNGLVTSNFQNITLLRCKFDTIGTSITDANSQGFGVYASNGSNLIIRECEGLKSYGQGMFFFNGITNLDVKRNNIHDTFYRAIQLYSGSCTGEINDNDLWNCGSINTTTSGIGCNGIYAAGDQTGVNVRHNRIKNVLENGIEGNLGTVEFNVVNGTGIDTTGHPTPSIEGIYANGKSYRYNRIINAKGCGIKNYSASTISNLEIIGNVIDSSLLDAISVNSDTGYSNVKILDNKSYNVSRCVYMANRNASTNVVLGNNKQIQGTTVYGTLSLPAKLLETVKPSLLNGAFSGWDSTTAITSWVASNATVSQTKENERLLPTLTSAGTGYTARISQDLILPFDDNTVSLRIAYKGNDPLKIAITPRNADGTLNNSFATGYTDTSYDSVNYREVNFIFNISKFQKVKIEIGTSDTANVKYVQLKSIEDRIISNS